MKIIKIDKKIIGGNRCFIIAEAGVNHNGSLTLAKKMVDAAKAAGADAVKFQTYKAENENIKTAGMAEYQKGSMVGIKTQFEMAKKLELEYDDFVVLKRYCDKKKILFLSTPSSEDAIDFLEPLVPLYKIGSGDLTNPFFLKMVSRKKKPIILSTGMANIREIEEAVNTIKRTSNKKIILLHCTTNYPCPPGEVNLRAVLTLEKKFNLPVGYSDHTEGILTPIMAVAMGAKIIEKHFTLDKKMRGPDHKASLDPQELKKMVSLIKEAEMMLGNGIKKPFFSEQKIKRVARKSIVAKTEIKKGEIIRKEMLAIKRPGTGIEPKYFNKVVGARAKKNIKSDELIAFNQIN